LAKLGDGTQGDVLYYGASGAPARLGFGTSGDFLKTQGTGANPTWDSAGGGAWTFLQANTASDAAILETTGVFSTTYKEYMVVVNNLKSNNTGPSTNIYAQVRTGGSYLTGSLYEYCTGGIASGGTGFIGRAGRTATAAQITQDGTGVDTDFKTQSIIFWLDNPASTTYNTNVRYQVNGLQNETQGGASTGNFTYYYSSSPQALDGLKIYGASDNVTGTMYVYGLALS
jgi:hypothetical protein